MMFLSHPRSLNEVDFFLFEIIILLMHFSYFSHCDNVFGGRLKALLKLYVGLNIVKQSF